MRRAAWSAMLAFAAACSPHAAGPTYTLYRNSPVDPTARLHWATFDAGGEGTGATNKANCAMAASLLDARHADLTGNAQPERFWCEKGRFHP